MLKRRRQIQKQKQLQVLWPQDWQTKNKTKEKHLQQQDIISQTTDQSHNKTRDWTTTTDTIMNRTVRTLSMTLQRSKYSETTESLERQWWWWWRLSMIMIMMMMMMMMMMRQSYERSTLVTPIKTGSRWGRIRYPQGRLVLQRSNLATWPQTRTIEWQEWRPGWW